MAAAFDCALFGEGNLCEACLCHGGNVLRRIRAESGTCARVFLGGFEVARIQKACMGLVSVTRHLFNAVPDFSVIRLCLD